MKRKKNKNSFPARYLLLVLCGICLIVMFLAYSVGGTIRRTVKFRGKLYFCSNAEGN